jgi:putative heme-binding domain-containing protein
MRESLAVLLAAILGTQFCFESAHAADSPATSSNSSQNTAGSTKWFTQKSEIAPFILENVGAAAAVQAKPSESASAKSDKADASSASVAEKTAGMANDTDAAARDAFHIPPGFQVEHLFAVPREELGSWVSLAVDDQGRLLVSDQGGKGICRVTPPPIGSGGETKVEHLEAKISSAQGMVSAFGSLYVVVNKGGGSGLFRLRDTKGTGDYDEVVKLRDFYGPVGEHGPHGIKVSPDGKSLLIVCGNHTETPFTLEEMKTHPEYRSFAPPIWQEDLILPRLWDPNGHARGRMAPGGYIVQTDPEGKAWTMFSIGYRNSYDFDFNSDGELFAYDSDMEWDMGLPWYRPTRLVHAIQGSEFGWRSGAGVWPWYYVDSLAPITDMGPGSPVGVIFGYGAKFPAKYQKALFACDWTFGTMYAVHLEPEGSSYKAVKEELVSRNALPLTDVVVGKDGAIYFTTGGRNLQSDLFRVTYVGPESTALVDSHDSKGAELRELRHKIEAYQGQVAADPKGAVDFLSPFLGHADRAIRYAARAALEFQPVALWQDRVLAAREPETLINGAVALAHEGDKVLQPRLIEALGKLDFGKLTTLQQLGLLRAYELALVRWGRPSDTAVANLIKRFDEQFPGTNDLVNRELCNLLCNLQSPTIVAKTMRLLEQPSPPPDEQFGELLLRNRTYARPIEAMMESHPDRQKIQYAYALRNVKAGWSMDDRRAFFAFLREAARWSGGHSFQGFLKDIDREAFENATDAERLAIEALGARKPFSVLALPKPEGPGHDWTMDEVMSLAKSNLKDRDFNNGKKMFAAARCVVCHRFGGDGGATGPDLTQLAGRFNVKDLTESIIDPSKVIAEQYQSKNILTTSGKRYSGRVVADTGKHLIVVTDPEDSTKTVEIPKDEIEEETPSPISLMPAGLLKPLNEKEVSDLMAYLLSRGNPEDPMFKPEPRLRRGEFGQRGR